MERVAGKVIIVTGGASGIGEATCHLLAKHGAQVAVTDIDAHKIQPVVKKITDEGGVAQGWHMDIANEAQVKKVVTEIHQEWGKIDGLVNNAGIAGVNKPTHEVDEMEWDQVMNINVKGVFFCTKHVIPFMQKKGGSIVNICSIYGVISAPDIPVYHASKGAVRMITKTDALFYAKDKIRVNSIHPGFIWTPLVESFARQHPNGIDAFKQEVSTLPPLGRIGDPSDIAYAVLYFVSDESKFITGSELVIDGGFIAK